MDVVGLAVAGQPFLAFLSYRNSGLGAFNRKKRGHGDIEPGYWTIHVQFGLIAAFSKANGASWGPVGEVSIENIAHRPPGNNVGRCSKLEAFPQDLMARSEMVHRSIVQVLVHAPNPARLNYLPGVGGVVAGLVDQVRQRSRPKGPVKHPVVSVTMHIYECDPGGLITHPII